MCVIMRILVRSSAEVGSMVVPSLECGSMVDMSGVKGAVKGLLRGVSQIES